MPGYAKPPPVNASSISYSPTGNVAATTIQNAITELDLEKSYGFRNAIINGDFRIWQRGSSFTPATGGGTYTADRWAMTFAGGTPTNSVARTAFPAGISSTLGTEAEYFHTSTITTVGTATRYSVEQRIEDVRTFAGQTVTSSFWAKADSSRTLRVYLLQNFGTGGSTGVVVGFSDFNLTTNWQKFTFSLLVPSISGKTIGTNSTLNIRFDQAVAAGSVLDLWGVQVEAGSTATPFEQRPIGTELALCHRYYYKMVQEGTATRFAFGSNISAVEWNSHPITLPVTMRITPTVIGSGTGAISNGTSYEFTGVNLSNVVVYNLVSSPTNINLRATGLSGMVAFRPTWLEIYSGASFIAFNAEL